MGVEERYLMPDCVLLGRPPGTPFEGGTFKVQLDVQENYPLQARPPLEATQGQTLSQSPTDATRFWWHLYGS